MSLASFGANLESLSKSDTGTESLKLSRQLLIKLKLVERDLKKGDDTSLSRLPEVVKKSWNDKLNKNHKITNNHIKKLDKDMEKLFQFEIDSIYNYKIELDLETGEGVRNKKLIDRAIIVHLLRNGQFGQVEQLSKDLDLDVPQELIGKFSQLYLFLNELSHFQLDKVIDWCHENHSKLVELGSDIEYQMHILKFIQIFLKDQFSGMKFARENFPKFGFNHLEPIANFITEVSINGLDSLVKYYETGFHQLSGNFIQIFCSIQGLSSESPLYSTLIASILSLPNFIKFNKLITLKKLDWSTQNELPFEIPLPDFLKFHSIFICPVSKEETTLENPPRVLPCNHILAQSTVMNLCKNNVNNSFKCPYCPKITRQSETKLIRFINI